ncbi:putative O-methyltransferase [Xylariaceae sp. FL0255]|nr:putative O-methyltransferase [Xylariaceae sp. FL0255]
MTSSRVVDLSARIAANTLKVNEFLSSRGLPQPSFNIDGPSHSLIPPNELMIAIAPPKEYLTSFKHNELISQHAIMRFRLAEAIPVGGQATFQELAESSDLNETHIRKLLRFAMTQHIFCEPQPGVVAHTAASRLLVEDQRLSNWLRFSTDELWHASYETANAMEKFPGLEEPNKSGFALANNTNQSMFQYYQEHPDRQERFAAAMGFFAKRPGLEPEHVVDNYPWSDICDGGTVVDVGGSCGLISIAIARKFPKLLFIVQDLDARVIEDTTLQRPLELSDQQPVRGGEVYFLRAVLHNWSDIYAIKILRALVPALKPSAKALLNELVIPELNTNMPATQAARVRGNDLNMLTLQNGGDRELTQWDRLVTNAHLGFRFHSGHQPPRSAGPAWYNS